MIGPNVNSQCVGRLKLPFSRNQMSWVQMSKIGELYGGPQNPWKNSQSNKNTFFSRTRSSKVELSWEIVPTLRAFFNFKRVGLYCEPLTLNDAQMWEKTPRIWNFWNSRKCCKFLCEPKSASLLGVYSYFFFLSFFSVHKAETRHLLKFTSTTAYRTFAELQHLASTILPHQRPYRICLSEEEGKVLAWMFVLVAFGVVHVPETSHDDQGHWSW